MRSSIADDGAYLCHCGMCRRATGGVSAALKTVALADVTWTASPPDITSPRRSPSGRSVRHAGRRSASSSSTGESMDLTVGSFDDPARFRPTSNFSIETALPAWMDVDASARQAAGRSCARRRQMDKGRWQAPRLTFPSTISPASTASGSPIANWGRAGPVVLIHGYLLDRRGQLAPLRPCRAHRGAWAFA